MRSAFWKQSNIEAPKCLVNAPLCLLLSEALVLHFLMPGCHRACVAASEATGGFSESSACLGLVLLIPGCMGPVLLLLKTMESSTIVVHAMHLFC